MLQVTIDGQASTVASKKIKVAAAAPNPLQCCCISTPPCITGMPSQPCPHLPGRVWVERVPPLDAALCGAARRGG